MLSLCVTFFVNSLFSVPLISNINYYLSTTGVSVNFSRPKSQPSGKKDLNSTLGSEIFRGGGGGAFGGLRGSGPPTILLTTP